MRYSNDMKSLFPEKYHTSIYYFTLCILVIGMPISKFMISSAQIIMLCNWVLEGELKSKLISFTKNKPALVLSSLLLLHFIGVLYTSNMHDAYLDLRTKLPLLVLPLIISTSAALPEKVFKFILELFIAAVLFASVVSMMVLTGILHHPVNDTRGISIFISHIRFALLICVAIFSLVYLISFYSSVLAKTVGYLLILWLVVFLGILESLTGIAVLITTLSILMLYKVWKSKNRVLKYGVIIMAVLGIALAGCYLRTLMKERMMKEDNIDYAALDLQTPRGNEYLNAKHTLLTENGHPVWIYICDKELRAVWNIRSKIAFDSIDKKGNPLRYTLVRFMASKGLRKDEDGIKTLSNEEIIAVENGIPNVKYYHMNGLEERIYETLWEIDLYQKTGDANGHSLTQRFEYWKTALHIVKNNLLIGVGTGDVQKSFDEEFVKSNSKLDTQWRLHTHNQYLSIAVAFGIVGLIWFLFALFYPMVKLNMTFDFLYITFFIIAMVSFLTEDTLETQAGVTFYAFLNSFLLFSRKKNEATIQ